MMNDSENGLGVASIFENEPHSGGKRSSNINEQQTNKKHKLNKAAPGGPYEEDSSELSSSFSSSHSSPFFFTIFFVFCFAASNSSSTNLSFNNLHDFQTHCYPPSY